MRRLFASCTLLLLLAATTVYADTPVLPARAYLLMDATTGRVLHEFNGYAPLPIASTTKIMTALLAIERGNLDDVVTVGMNAYLTGEATMYLELGEQLRLEELLLGLMLVSANDAGVAIAEHIAGSEALFAVWMTEKAREIGATQTNFVNSHGLHHPDHYSSAYDLALISRYAMQNPQFRAIVSVEEIEILGDGTYPPRLLYNKNQLLGYYEGNHGVKNGWTEEAELTNVASARRGDTELIAVILGTESRLWTSSMALLDFGFDRYETIRVQDLPPEIWNDTFQAVTALPGELYVTVPKEARDLRFQYDRDVTGEVAVGDRVGTLRAFFLGDEVGQAPLMVTTVRRLEPAAQPASAMAWTGFDAAPVTPGDQPGRQLGWWGALALGAAAVMLAALVAAVLNTLRSQMRRFSV